MNKMRIQRIAPYTIVLLAGLWLPVSNVAADELICGNLNRGSYILADGTMAVVGQTLAGTMTSASYTIEVGSVGCLLALSATPANPPGVLAGEPGFSKDRYVSFNPTNNGAELVATRVTRVGSTTDKFVDCASLEDKGADGWYAALIDGPLPAPGDTTYYCDLSGMTTGLHVRGCSVVPGNTYNIAMTIDGSAFSADLPIITTLAPFPSRAFGDTVGGFFAGVWTAPDGLVTTSDIVAAVKKFGLDPEAALLARVDTDGAVPNAVATSGDILRAVRAFAGDLFGSGVTGCKTAGQCIPPSPGCE